MTDLLVDSDAATPAPTAARRAADRAQVEVRLLERLEDMVAGAELVGKIWGGDLLPVNLQRAIRHAGSYVGGALRDGRVVGILLGFLGLREGSLVLHSHVAAVVPGSRGRDVGFALKLHQRAWALERGVRLASWTFDPLVRRNAYFNLTKLAASGTAYEVNFYGTMGDGINGAEDSDRLVVEWHLDAPTVVAAADGHPHPVDIEGLRRRGAIELLAVGDDDEPVVNEAGGEVMLCRVPDDIIAMRSYAQRRSAAYRWRAATRETLGCALADGYQVSVVSRDGWYVLTKQAGRRR